MFKCLDKCNFLYKKIQFILFIFYFSMSVIFFFSVFSLCCTCLGTFGQVLECWDSERMEPVAIKIVRSILKYREAAMIEIDVLQRLAKHDPGGSRQGSLSTLCAYQLAFQNIKMNLPCGLFPAVAFKYGIGLTIVIIYVL